MRRLRRRLGSGCFGCEGELEMHVSKSILALGAFVILALTAALAYWVGKSDQTPLIAQSVPPVATSSVAALSRVADAPSPTVNKTEAPPPIKAIRKAQLPVPYSKTFTADEERLIDKWFHAEELCRGSSDEASVKLWCPRRDAAISKLNSVGICHGRYSDGSAAEYDIHHCGPDSYR